MREHWLSGVVVMFGFAVLVMCIAAAVHDDCPQGSVAAAGIAWCR